MNAGSPPRRVRDRARASGRRTSPRPCCIVLPRIYPRVAGVKPIETGMGEATVSDAARLERVSSFHVKHFGYVFAEPLSPHLAARETDTPIRLDVLVPLIQAARGPTPTSSSSSCPAGSSRPSPTPR